jgi:nitrogen fixation/metabolism regulation signal transduction histidine kinase
MNSRITVLAGVGILSLFLLASLMLMSDATQNSTRFGNMYSELLIINSLGLTTFIALIALNIRRLVRQLRRNEPGSRLTLRMVALFTILAVSPVLIVYGFSLEFLRRGIDSWFDVAVEQALQDSLDLSRASLDLRTRELLKQTTQFAEEISANETSITPLNLDQLRAPGSTIIANRYAFSATPDIEGLRLRSGAEELLLLNTQGRLLASSSNNTDIVPNLPSEPILLQLRQGRNYIGVDTMRGGGLYVRAAVNVTGPGLSRDGRILQALYPVSERMNKLAENVQIAYAKYTELAYLRDQLKISFTMTLTLVLLFSIFCAVWAAFYSARRLSAPIADLARGTQAVAAGDYETTIPVTSNDDFGFLAGSFNKMTRKIKQARDDVRRSRDEISVQRTYLEVVLARLSSGVMTLDTEQQLKTANQSASQILGVDIPSNQHYSLKALSVANAHLQPFYKSVESHLQAQRSDWQEQIVLFGSSGRQVLLCRGTMLAGTNPSQAGHVVVFDDITALVQGQRDAAWSEAARRLAHEIKNPLTPIQLSAERLRLKYLSRLGSEEGETLDRLTHTIIQQVETMKGMVNTFSDYARPPKIQHKPVSLNKLIQEVLDLFRTANASANIETTLDETLPTLSADPGRLRQVLNNLISNALEASDEEASPYILISTRRVRESNSTFIEFRIADRGRGISAELMDRVFEPYVTNKPKGTGLGLAIVKKIIDEHGGVVWIENNREGGASVVIRLPGMQDTGQSGLTEIPERDAV